jgi:acyl carrier protein
MTSNAQEVARMVAVQLGRRQVRLEDHLVEDLGASSLDIVNLTVAIEDRYRIAIREEEAATLRTVADVHALVLRLTGS